MADSWLTDGNCKECRRRKYCSKECKAHRVSTKRFLYGAIMSATGLSAVCDANPEFSENMKKAAYMTGALE